VTVSIPKCYKACGTRLIHKKNKLEGHSNAKTAKRLRDKFVPVHATKALGGNKVTAPFILYLGARWRSVVNIMLRPFYPKKILPVFIN
jgi:hypothetical protein